MNSETDKSKELTTSIKLLNEKLHFEGKADHNEPVSIDYTPPFGDNLGYTSLELLLLSLSSCIGSSVLIFLRKMKKTITGLEIKSTGIRKEEHPTGFRTISLHLKLISKDIAGSDLEEVIKLSEDTYCPVWNMMKGNVEINVTYDIVPE